MRVILKRTWFVGGHRYRSVGKIPVEVPDNFRNQVPKDAIVCEAVTKEYVPVNVTKEDEPEKEPYVNPAHDLDSERNFSEAFNVVNKEAESEVDKARKKLKKPVKNKLPLS